MVEPSGHVAVAPPSGAVDDSGGAAFRACAIVPTLDNPRTIGGVVSALVARDLSVVVVDDGSGPDARAVIDGLVDDARVHLVRRAENGGKGAAVKDGLRRAAELGFTHALQVDADGQHDLGAVPELLGRARERPDAVVLASPVFDDTVPKGRLYARLITTFWTHVETRGRVIADPMCGFRIYPVGPAVAVRARGNRMDFDPEVAVRLVWAGVPVVNVPVHVRYPGPDEGGVSHFRMFRDNVLISWMHTRLVFLMIVLTLLGRIRRRPR
jgi:glycosyltransferase involved in cell wall biosynthesis